MDEPSENWTLPSADAPALLLCLVLGTLEAMRGGAWPSEAGIWTLGRPAFRDLCKRGGLPADVLEILNRADELDSFEEIRGTAAASERIDGWIACVRRRLAEISDHDCWALRNASTIR